MNRRPSPSDVSDDEWEFVAPYLSLLPQMAAQRRHEVREVFNALRWMVRAGAPWRLLPVHFPPTSRRGRRSISSRAALLAAGCFAALVHDLRLLVRAAAGRHPHHPHPSAAIVASRTRRATVESGARAGVDGHKQVQKTGAKNRCKKQVRGSKVHAVVDTMGTLLALAITPANEAERRQVDVLAQQVRAVTAERVEVLSADAAYTGEDAAALAQEHGIQLVVLTRPQASKGVMLLPKRSRGGAKLRLGQPLPPPRTRLRTASHHADWSAFRCLRLSLAP